MYASSCNGNCESCHFLADAGNARTNPSPAAPLGDFVKKVSSASLKVALEKVSEKYQGAAVNTPSPENTTTPSFKALAATLEKLHNRFRGNTKREEKPSELNENQKGM